jgi:pimeloyl-ACP methyl ester carboxylesterase
LRAQEVVGVCRLAGVAIGGGVCRVQQMHAGIAGRAFAGVGPVARPVHVVHELTASATYGTVRVAVHLASVVAAGITARTVAGPSLDDNRSARIALAILNGVYGDTVVREAPALATLMTVRQRGRPVPLEPEAVHEAFPTASGQLVVFLHGLTETEGAWCFKSTRHHGRADVSYGTLLQQHLGLTPVFVRYNTGLHISDNGRLLADLLDRLVEAWPVPVQDLVLIGHSMGGLVARSALHQSRGGTEVARAWTRHVHDTITLGTPHLGAPLERAVHALTHTLATAPETRPLATVLAARSAGIKDLRRGTLVEADWTARDLDDAAPGRHTHVPLHDGARHFAVLATLTPDPHARTADLLGDVMVPPRSACGDSRDDSRLAFPSDHVHRLGRLHHLDLLNHPKVYQQIRRWLTDRPDPS